MDEPPENVQPMEVDQDSAPPFAIPQVMEPPQEAAQEQQVPVMEGMAGQLAIGAHQAATEEPVTTQQPMLDSEKEKTVVAEDTMQDQSGEIQSAMEIFPAIEAPVEKTIISQEPTTIDEATIAREATTMENTSVVQEATAIEEPAIAQEATIMEGTSSAQEPLSTEHIAEPEVPGVDSAEKVAEMLAAGSPAAAVEEQAAADDISPNQEPIPRSEQGAAETDHAVTETENALPDLPIVDDAQPFSEVSTHSADPQQAYEAPVVDAIVEQPLTNETATTPSTASNSGDAEAHSNLDSLQVLAALNNALAYQETHEAGHTEDTVLVPPSMQGEGEGEGEGMSDRPDSAGSYDEGSTLTSLGPQDGLLSAKSEGFNLNSEDDGLKDYSTPESRFAGVFLDIVPDRRKLRGYIPSDEVKASRSLKVTIKKPQGWISRLAQAVNASQTQEASTNSGRRSGRQRKPNRHFDDDFDIDVPTSSRKREERQRVFESEETTRQEGPSAEPRKAEKAESEEFTLPAEEVDTPDQGMSDNTDEDLVVTSRKSRKSEILQPTRKSGRVAEKGKRAHWDAVDEGQEVSINRLCDTCCSSPNCEVSQLDDLSANGLSPKVSKRKLSLSLP